MEKRNLKKSKLEGYSGKSNNDIFPVVVKVNEAGYIPDDLKVRSVISPFIFTSEASSSTIEKLEKDLLVVSVSINRSLNEID